MPAKTTARKKTSELAQLRAREQQLVIVPGATHLFEEPGALEEVARLAANWFTNHLSHSAVAPVS